MDAPELRRASSSAEKYALRLQHRREDAARSALASENAAVVAREERDELRRVAEARVEKARGSVRDDGEVPHREPRKLAERPRGCGKFAEGEQGAEPRAVRREGPGRRGARRARRPLDADAGRPQARLRRRRRRREVRRGSRVSRKRPASSKPRSTASARSRRPHELAAAAAARRGPKRKRWTSRRSSRIWASRSGRDRRPRGDGLAGNPGRRRRRRPPRRDAAPTRPLAPALLSHPATVREAEMSGAHSAGSLGSAPSRSCRRCRDAILSPLRRPPVRSRASPPRRPAAATIIARRLNQSETGKSRVVAGPTRRRPARPLDAQRLTPPRTARPVASRAFSAACFCDVHGPPSSGLAQWREEERTTTRAPFACGRWRHFAGRGSARAQEARAAHTRCAHISRARGRSDELAPRRAKVLRWWRA